MLTLWITHSLLDPETTPANGEVSTSAASSIVLCRVLLCSGAFACRTLEVEPLRAVSFLLMGGGACWSDRRRRHERGDHDQADDADAPARSNPASEEDATARSTSARLDPAWTPWPKHTSDPQQAASGSRGGAARARAGDRRGDADQRARGSSTTWTPSARSCCPTASRRSACWWPSAAARVGRDRGGRHAGGRDPVACAALAARRPPAKAFFVRKERKEHGLQRGSRGRRWMPGDAAWSSRTSSRPAARRSRRSRRARGGADGLRA